DGKILASSVAETVRLWDVGGQLLPRWLAWTLTVLLGLAGVGVLIRRRLGGWLAVAGVIASLAVGAVGVLRGGSRLLAELPHPDGRVKTLAFASDGRTLAVGGNSLRLWDIGRPRPVELSPLQGMSGSVEALSFAPEGPWLFALTPSGEVVVGQVAAGKVVR